MLQGCVWVGGGGRRREDRAGSGEGGGGRLRGGGGVLWINKVDKSRTATFGRSLSCRSSS